MDPLEDILKQTRAYSCLECGKCTGSCPVSRVNHEYSPRSILMKALKNRNDGALNDDAIWTCLTCAMCHQRCPVNIDYSTFTREIRGVSLHNGEKAICSHGGAFQSLMRIMTASKLNQNRLDWLTDDLKTVSKGEVLYFVGCLPYYDVFFNDLKVHNLDAARGTIRILNKLGIKPVLLPDERCCGHDLLWSGDVENFKRLASHNMELIKKSGAKTIVFSCPECYSAFKQDYPEHVENHSLDLMHITEFVDKELASGKVKFKKSDKKITFQDSCRLGRHLGIYDAPRNILNAIPGIEFHEMDKNRNKAICCGVGNWLTCTAFAKMIQENRLREAKATDAELLITECPKCEIHFKCALSDDRLKKEVNIGVQDLISFAAEVLE
jgi:heterodisulfide reductase subunit D